MHKPRTGENTRYIGQLPDWPAFRYDANALAGPLAQVHRAQGQLMGRMAALGLAQREQATLQVLTQEVLKTSEIEGELLNLDAVRTSVARRLGLDIGALAASDRHVDGVVDVVLDATRNFDQALSRERVHFQAPPAGSLLAQTDAFVQWFNAAPVGDAIVKAGLAHLWLVTLHPFDDGNGRISRAVGDMALARAEETSADGPRGGNMLSSASTALARRYSANAKPITTNWKSRKKARWT